MSDVKRVRPILRGLRDETRETVVYTHANHPMENDSMKRPPSLKRLKIPSQD